MSDEHTDVEVIEEPVVTPTEPVVTEGQEGAPAAAATEEVEEEILDTPTTAPAQTEQPWMKKELEWLRRSVSDLSAANQRLQTELEEFETAGMEPEDAAARKVQRMQQELDAERARSANQQWKEYCLQFGIEPERLTGEDPVGWLHETLTDQQSKLTAEQKRTAELMKTVAALKKAQTKPDVPKVTSGTGQAATNKKTVWDYSLDEIEQMAEAAAFGQLDPADIPPLS
jgi:predicted RNase H-like nuclease (RuvC/YqgF family)